MRENRTSGTVRGALGNRRSYRERNQIIGELNFLMTRIKLFTITTLFVLSLPVAAHANAGVPMIFLSFPIMLIALLPVIFIETSIFKRIVPIPYKKSFVSNGIANAISTIAGFPLAWGLLLAIELLTTGGSCGPGFDTISKSIITVIVEAAWLCPHEDHLYWLIPTAFIISLIVAFFISLVIEYYVNKRFHKECDKKQIRRAVYIANISSYCLLIFIGFGYLGFSIFEVR
jgi:hypothetical protein